MTSSEPNTTDVADDENEEQEENTTHIWLQILSQVHESRRKAAAGKQIIVVGDKRSGKSALIAKLRGFDESKAQVSISSGLEYTYLDVRDDVREEDSMRTAIWIVDGEPQYAGLLRHAANNLETLSNTLVLVCLPISQPLSLLDSALAWLTALETGVVTNVRQGDEVGFADLKRSIEKDWKQASHSFGKVNNTTEANELQSTVDSQSQSRDAQDDSDELKLEDGILQRNLAVPIVLCVTKCDTISQVEKEFDLNDEHFDFIQVHLRRLALKYGAALVYTSAKEDKNVDVLTKYVLHRLYGTQCERSAYVVEKDCVYVPAGWDTQRKIGITFENISSLQPDAPFEEAFGIARQRVPRTSLNRQTPTAATNPTVAVDLVVEDEQVFLTRMQSALSRTLEGGVQAQAPLGSVAQPQPQSQPHTTTVAPAAVPDLASSPANRSAPAPRPGASVAQVPANERVLANFFNSLLTKKGGAPVSGEAGTPSDSDRLGNNRKSSGLLNAGGTMDAADKEKENQTS